MSEARFNHIETDLETVKQILTATARLTQSNSESIDRLVANQEATQRQVDANTSANADLRLSTTELRLSTTELRLSIETMADEMTAWFTVFSTQAEEDRQAIREMQSEVRGMQVEMRRILDRLLNEEEEENGQ